MKYISQAAFLQPSGMPLPSQTGQQDTLQTMLRTHPCKLASTLDRQATSCCQAASLWQTTPVLVCRLMVTNVRRFIIYE